MYEEYIYQKSAPHALTDLRINGWKFAIIGTHPFFAMTVEKEAPAKEALMIFKELWSAWAKRGKGVVQGFTGELHRFFSGEVFFAGTRSDSKQTSMQATQMQPHTNSNKANRLINLLINACKYWNLDWVHCSCQSRPQIIQTCRHRCVVPWCESMRGLSRRMIGHTSFIVPYPDTFDLPLPPFLATSTPDPTPLPHLRHPTACSRPEKEPSAASHHRHPACPSAFDSVTVFVIFYLRCFMLHGIGRHLTKLHKIWAGSVERVCVCVCVTMKIRCQTMSRTTSDTSDTLSSSKHNAKKITTRVRGPFHQLITAVLTEEKREEKQFTKPTHVAVYLFRDLDRDRNRL